MNTTKNRGELCWLFTRASLMCKLEGKLGTWGGGGGGGGGGNVINGLFNS